MKRMAVTLLVGVLAGWLPSSAGAAAGDPDEVAKEFVKACWAVAHGDASGRQTLDGLMAAPNWATTQLVFEAALKESPWMFDSYANGGDPATAEPAVAGTEMMAVPRFEIGELAKVSLTTSASGTPRPVYLKKVGDAWKVAIVTPLCIGLTAADGNPRDDLVATATPEGAIHLLLEGCYLFILGDQREGEKLCRAALVDPPSETSWVRFVSCLKEKQIIFYSYAQGSTNEGQYVNFDPTSFTVKITRTEKLGEEIKAFIASSGADNPRPFRSKVTPRGQLRIVEWSSIYVDVKPIPKATW